MAVNPIAGGTLGPGLTPGDYSPWSPAGQARSAIPGILNYVPNANPLPVPTASPTFIGGTQYGNYVRSYPGLMAAFQDPNQTGSQNIQDWGKAHWLNYGQHNPSRVLPPKPTDTPISLGDTTDTGGARVSVGSAGLPMPDVEGYKYVYPRWSWDNDAGWTTTGYESDIDKYEYFPYFPGQVGDRRTVDGRVVEHMLVGLQLIPK